MSTSFKFLDTGDLFGLPTREVFKGTNVTTLVPRDAQELMQMLPLADLVGFGGGADIHPSLYGCRDVASSVGHRPSHRDLIESDAFQYCVQSGVPMFGICRGAQLLCALSGGKLVQDVSNHGMPHSIYTEDNGLLPMTSTHHQMMYPWEVDHTLLAWTDNLSSRYVHSIPNYEQRKRDPEAAFFTYTGALAVQGHPEWMDPRSKTVQVVRDWVKKYCNVNVVNL